MVDKKHNDLSLQPTAASGGLQSTIPTDVNRWRQSLLVTRSGGELLNKLLDPHDAAELIPKLSTDDLFSCIRQIGLADSDEVLALTSGTQFQGLLDSDCWNRDTFEVDRVDPWLHALMRAGEDVLGPHILAQNDSMISLLAKSSIHVIVVEEPDDFDPPDFEHVLTPDGRLCICFPASADRDLPIKLFLDWLIRLHPIYGINLLIHLPAALPSNLEEDAYRWRSARLADRGYIDYYDALRIYVPATKTQVAHVKQTMVEGIPVTGRWMLPFSSGDSRLSAALEAVPEKELEHVQSALALAMNMALSADRVEIWDEDHQGEIIARIRAGLALGLTELNGPRATAASDAQTLISVPLTLLFRIGYGRMLDAAVAVRGAGVVRLLKGSAGRVDGVDIGALRSWAEWLTARHPCLPDGQPPVTEDDLTLMADNARTIADLARVCGKERPPEVGIAQYLLTRLVSDLLGIVGQGPLNPDQLVSAHAVLIADGEVRPSTRDAAYVWWLENNGRHRLTVDVLLRLIEDEFAPIAMEALDSKFVPFLWIADSSSQMD